MVVFRQSIYYLLQTPRPVTFLERVLSGGADFTRRRSHWRRSDVSATSASVCFFSPCFTSREISRNTGECARDLADSGRCMLLPAMCLFPECKSVGIASRTSDGPGSRAAISRKALLDRSRRALPRTTRNRSGVTAGQLELGKAWSQGSPSRKSSGITGWYQPGFPGSREFFRRGN